MTAPIRVLAVGSVDDMVARLDAEREAIAVTHASERDALARLGAADCIVYVPGGDADDALSFVADLRDADADVPIVLVRSDAANADGFVRDAFAAGVTDHVGRTDAERPATLGDRIEQAVLRRRARDDPCAGSDDTPDETVESYRSLTDDVLDTSDIGTFILDAEFRVVWMTQATEEYFGLDREAAVGRDKRDLIDGEIKDIFEHPARFADLVTSTYDDNTYTEEFECHVTGDGDRTERWLHHWSQPIESGRYAGGRIEHYTDVTARKRYEAALRRERNERDRIVETSPIGIAIVDADGTFSFGNERAEEILGFSRAELNDRSRDAPAIDITDLDGGEFADADQPFRRVLQDGKRLVAQEVRVRREDGEHVWLSINGAPLDTDDGGVERAVFAFEDITHRKEREAELEETVEKLAASNKKLQRFAYITSHDLQEPLRMISAYLQLLERRYADELDSDAREFIDFAVGGAERMRDMINDLLEYSRIDTHGDPFEPVDANETIENVRADLRIRIEERDAEVTNDDLPTVVADPTQFEQLLRNLVSNGIKYNDEDPTVHVSAERLDDVWRFSVSDDGIGVDERHAEGVFEVFKRLHGNQEYSGTGIGLAVCRKIVDRHDGRIWVDSASGEGSTFHFTIPVTTDQP